MRQGLSEAKAMGVGHGSFEALGGIQNGNPFAQGKLLWRINKPVSVFVSGQWRPNDYFVGTGVQVSW